MLPQLGQPVAVFVKKSLVEDGSWGSGLGVEHTLRDGLQQCHVAAEANLQKLVCYLGAVANHPAHPLRVLIAAQAGLGQRVDRNDLRTSIFGFFERGEHARMVGAGVLADDDDQVGFRKVVVADRALANADGHAHGPAGGFVAHIGAVRQVVGAVSAREQLVGECGLVGGAATRVEGGLVGRVKALELGGDHLKGLGPTDRAVVVAAGGLVDGFDQTALHTQPVLALLPKVVQGMLGPETCRDGDRSGLPGDGLGAVFTEFEDLTLARVGPGAAHAVESVFLVHRQQSPHSSCEAHLGDCRFH